MNIGGRLGPVSSINPPATPKKIDDSAPAATPSPAQRRNKRARVEVDDDDIIMVNGNAR